MYHLEIKHTLTYTIIKYLTVTFIIFGGALALTHARCRNNTIISPPIRKLVTRLGIPGNNDMEDVKRLSRTPYASAGELISQLHTIKDPDKTIVGYGSIRFNHLIWAIAALRYITGGMDFCASTKWKLASQNNESYRSYWLHFSDKNCVTFFSVWPSRDQYYVAPIDAQKQIIKAWKHWYIKKGKTFNYKPLVNPMPSQWLDGVEKPIYIESK